MILCRFFMYWWFLEIKKLFHIGKRLVSEAVTSKLFEFCSRASCLELSACYSFAADLINN